MGPEIHFNRPFVSGGEEENLRQVVVSRKWSGDGPFTRRAQQILESKCGFRRAYVTSSCTDALEMAAILTGIGPGDEVLIPSFTFVSSANPFIMRGARPIFLDSGPTHPNVEIEELERRVTDRTRVLLVMHYGGVACPMDEILEFAERRRLLVVEDAAQCIDASYRGKPLGSLGHLGALSFHETKNISSGEGGALLVNDPCFQDRAEIIREKGTNRMAFFRGEVDKYGWVDIGSSFLLSEFGAAVLTAQLDLLEEVQRRRRAIWRRYMSGLQPLTTREDVRLPDIPAYAEHNAHIFFLVLRDLDTRTRFITHLKAQRIYAVFHYQSLHRSAFFARQHDGRQLPHADHYSDCLVRLPLYNELSEQDVDRVVAATLEFFSGEAQR